MKPIECVHEEDVLAAVNTGRWPDRADAELRAHVAACDVCQDVVAVASAFADVDEHAPHALPDSSVVWLRSQIRARAEATRLAERPITVAQAIAFASIVGVLGALLGASSSWLQAGLRWGGAAAAHLDPRAIQLPAGVGATVAEHLGLAAMVAVGLMVTAVATYWVVRDN